MFQAEAEKDMDEEEELFNVEESLPNPETYSWEDKYRPRKPRYLNKVHTGYEWNKYNQTHYEYAFFFPVVKLTELPLVQITLPQKSSKGTNSIYFIPILLRVQRLPRMSRSKNLAMMRRWFFDLPLDPLMRTSLSGSSTETGSFHTKSKRPRPTPGPGVLMEDSRGFKCTFDRGCLSLWFNFRRDVSNSMLASVLLADTLFHSTTASNHITVKPTYNSTKFMH